MDRARINFGWLTRLRWGAVAGQLATMLVVSLGLDAPLPWPPLLALVAVELALNTGAALWLRAGGRVGDRLAAATLAVDVMVLTALLFLTGGASNPFNFLYLVYLALAAVVLPSRWTWALVALSLLCSAALFTRPGPHAEHMRQHIQGMWIACAVAAAFIVYFVSRVRRDLAAREADLQAERALAARNERLGSLATLSAGAAHELATPLSTIAVVTRELERQAGRGELGNLDDFALIRAQLGRCRQILDQMAVRSGEGPGEEARAAQVATLVTAASANDEEGRAAIRVTGADAERAVFVPERAVVQALRAVIRNAQDASPPGAEVVITVAADGDDVCLDVQDEGAGMQPDVLARVGEPFFTTKSPGRGMGLGVFLARAVVERIGGRFAIRSEPGRGTRVTVHLPGVAAGRASTAVRLPGAVA